jgi:hypothetical protein
MAAWISDPANTEPQNREKLESPEGLCGQLMHATVRGTVWDKVIGCAF